MGLGRFGPGGCCTCDGGGGEPPTFPPLPPQWSAGDCRHCGLCDPEPSLPYGPDQYCPYELTDGFDTEKRMPYVPYWVYGPRNGYAMVYDMPSKYLTYWDGNPFNWFGNQCGGYPWAGGSVFPTGIDGWTLGGSNSCPGLLPLQNKTYACDFPTSPVSLQAENLLAVQSPNSQTDVLPLRFEHRIKCNISREALPKWAMSGLAGIGAPLFGTVAGVSQRFGSIDAYGSAVPNSGFGWYDALNYGSGSFRHALSITTRADVFEDYFVADLHPYYCTPFLEGTVSVKNGNEAFVYVTISKEDGILAKWGENEIGFVVIHMPDPSDNRQMDSTFEIHLNGAVVKRQTFSMHRPGYKRNEPANSEQDEKQFFCAHDIVCLSEYFTLGQGPVVPKNALAGWYNYQSKEMVRRAVWWDDWYALASRP